MSPLSWSGHCCARAVVQAEASARLEEILMTSQQRNRAICLNCWSWRSGPGSIIPPQKIPLSLRCPATSSFTRGWYVPLVPMTEVKRAVVGLTRVSHRRSPNDMHCTKTLPSLAEVEERRLRNLRIFACEVAGVWQGLFICAMPKRC